MMLRATLVGLALVQAACQNPVSDVDEVFYDWDDRRVFCAVGLDTVSRNSDQSIMDGLDRAAANGEVLMLFTHEPGRTVPLDRVEAVLSYARDLGLDFVTARDLAAGGPPRAGVALGFDDSAVASWYDMRPLLDRYGARVSFYVTRYHNLSSGAVDQLRELQGDGHSIEAHSRDHLHAPDYVEEHGLRAYMRDEALPSITALRSDGFDPVAYAYPFGARTSEIDRELLEHVDHVRSVTFAASFIADPCPE